MFFAAPNTVILHTKTAYLQKKKSYVKIMRASVLLYIRLNHYQILDTFVKVDLMCRRCCKHLDA